MKKEGIKQLPLYPEERRCKRPTTEQVLRLFSLTERQVLLRRSNGRIVQVFPSDLTDLQREVLRLLGAPEHTFHPPV